VRSDNRARRGTDERLLGSRGIDPASEGSLVTDKKEMPADGAGTAKGKPDGISGSPDTGESGRSHGRSPGGESGGGAYPNPHSENDADRSSFSGGQTEKAYYGGDNPNATAGPPPNLSADEEREGADSAAGHAHRLEIGGRTIEVTHESGVAAAEATGKIATDAPYEEEQNTPGAG
jgi:hypothetical protein